MGESDADKSIPVGIGGWLALFLLSMMLLSPLVDLARLGSHPEENNLFMWLVFVTIHGLGLYAGILMLRGKAKGVRWARIWLKIVLCIGVWNVVTAVVGAYQHTMESSKVLLSLRTLAYAAMWLAYLGESKRVKNTYYRTPEPPTVANPPTQTMRPEKSGPKLNGWKRLGIVASIIWIIVTFFYSTLSEGFGTTASEAAIVAIVPVPFAWGFVYLAIFVVRWVKRGFAAGHARRT